MAAEVRKDAQRHLPKFCWILSLLLGMLSSGMTPSVQGEGDKVPKLPEAGNYLSGRYRASKHAGFRTIRDPFAGAPPNYLRIKAADAFEHMAEAALKDGIRLQIISGFRTFNRQKTIWENKFLGHTLVQGENLASRFPNDPAARVKRILQFSAAPGSSRHHWGTDADINSVNPEYFSSGEGLKVYLWLQRNAGKFGFCQVYDGNRESGYQEEKWHWSYIPLSRECLEKFRKVFPPGSIRGFAGDSHLPENFYEDYVLGISHACR